MCAASELVRIFLAALSALALTGHAGAQVSSVGGFSGSNIGPITTGAGTVSAGLCDGLSQFDLNASWCASCPKPAKNPGQGAVVQAQSWYLAPFNTSNQTTSLSDAFELCIGP